MKKNLMTIHPEPVGDNVIETLEGFLDDAKTGKLSAIAAAVVYRDGSTGSGWSLIHSNAIMLGAIEFMKHRIIKATEDE